MMSLTWYSYEASCNAIGATRTIFVKTKLPLFALCHSRCLTTKTYMNHTFITYMNNNLGVLFQHYYYNNKTISNVYQPGRRQRIMEKATAICYWETQTLNIWWWRRWLKENLISYWDNYCQNQMFTKWFYYISPKFVSFYKSVIFSTDRNYKSLLTYFACC